MADLIGDFNQSLPSNIKTDLKESTLNVRGDFNASLPSIIKNPFKKNKITSIFIRGNEELFSKHKMWEFSGKIEFTNGDTGGEQRFEGTTFDEVVLKIKATIESLE